MSIVRHSHLQKPSIILTIAFLEPDEQQIHSGHCNPRRTSELTCQYITPAISKHIGDSLVTCTALEKSADHKEIRTKLIQRNCVAFTEF